MRPRYHVRFLYLPPIVELLPLVHPETDRACTCSENVLFPTQVPVLCSKGVRSVAGGIHHMLALTADGQVWSWGRGTYGRLGHGDEVDKPLPTPIAALNPGSPSGCSSPYHRALHLTTLIVSFHTCRACSATLNDKVISIAAGEAHSVACTEKGSKRVLHLFPLSLSKSVSND